MTALYIVLGVLAFLILLGLLKLTFRVSWCQDVLVTVVIGVIPIRFRFGGKKAPPEHAPKQTSPPAEKKAKKKKKKSEPEKRKPKITELIPLIKQALVRVCGKFRRYLRLEKYVLKVRVGTGDAAQTAMLYGLISGQAANLTEYLTRIRKHPRRAADCHCEIVPDYLGESFDFYVDIALSLRVWHLLSVGVTAIRAFLQYRRLTKPVKGTDEHERNTVKADH